MFFEMMPIWNSILPIYSSSSLHHSFEDFLRCSPNLSSEEILVFLQHTFCSAGYCSTNQTIITLKNYNNGSCYLCARHLTNSTCNPHVYSALLSQTNRGDNENHRRYHPTHVPQLINIKLRIWARYFWVQIFAVLFFHIAPLSPFPEFVCVSFTNKMGSKISTQRSKSISMEISNFTCYI